MHICAVGFALVLHAAAVAPLATKKSPALISPELDPKSDKKFFKKDYPYDNSPEPQHSDPHPSPDVQASNKYDADYVKDENNDKAAWDDMMKYAQEVKDAESEVERLKKELAKQKEALEKLRKAAEKEGKDDEDAKNEDDAAKKKAADEKGEADKDAKDEDDAKTAVEIEAEKVTAEVKSLEECKSQLKAAMEKLERLKSEVAGKVEKETETAAEEKSADKAEDEAEAVEKKEEETASEMKKAYQEAEEKHEEEVKDMQTLTKELVQAESRLRAFRSGKDGASRDDDGEKRRSGASRGRGSLALALLVASVLTHLVPLTA